jgi:hypothetical protein
VLVDVSADATRSVGVAEPPAGVGLRVQVGIDAAVTANHHVCVRESDADGAMRLQGPGIRFAGSLARPVRRLYARALGKV